MQNLGIFGVLSGVWGGVGSRVVRVQVFGVEVDTEKDRAQAYGARQAQAISTDPKARQLLRSPKPLTLNSKPV